MKKMSKIFILCLILLLIASVSYIFAAGQKEADQEGAKKIVYVSDGWESGEGESEYFKFALAEFHKIHPDVKVEVLVWPPREQQAKIMAAFAVGNVPDVLQINAPHIDMLGPKGILDKPLADMVKWMEEQPYFPNTLDSLKDSETGQLWGPPNYSGTSIMFYNKDLFDDYPCIIMIPFQIIMIPLYMMMTKIGWNDTYQGVIFPSLIAGFGVFLIRQNMIKFPDDLLDAARIEGCGEFRIYRSIVIPNIKAALATLGIYTFMANWDDFLWLLVVLSSNKLYTIPLGLAMFSQRVEMMGLLTWNISVAAAIIAVAPVLVAFIFFQKYIVKGVLLSGMGGR